MIGAPTLDCAADLASLAAECLAIERHVAGPGMMQDLARGATRDMLADHARELGFVTAEIEAAVDAALASASEPVGAKKPVNA